MNNHASDEAVTTTVSALSDDRLLERTKELSGIEHHLEVVVIDHLREIQKRRLYLRRGFSSLFDYAVRELGYSDAAAWRRIKAMRLCAEVEGVRERLRNGTMTLNAAAQLQHAFDRQERKKARAARSAPGGAGTGFGAAARSQNGSAPPRPADRKPAPAPAPVLDPEARRELVEQASGKSSREVMQLLAEVDPELAAPAERVRPLGGGRWELKAVIDDECRRGLERLKGLLSHVDPHLTSGQLMARLGAAQGPPVPRRSAPDVGAAHGAAGAGRTRPSRPGPAAARAARRAGQRRRANFGGEDAGGLGSRRCLRSEAGCHLGQGGSFGGEGVGSGGGAAGRRSRVAAAGGPRSGPPGHFGSEPGGRHNFGAEDAAPRRAGCDGGGGAGCAAGADRNFGSEGGRPDRPRHPGGGQARGLAARPGPLQLRGPHQRAPLRLPTPAADRSRRAVCPGRRRRAGQSPTAVRRASSLPPRRRRIRPPRQ